MYFLNNNGRFFELWFDWCKQFPRSLTLRIQTFYFTPYFIVLVFQHQSLISFNSQIYSEIQKFEMLRKTTFAAVLTKFLLSEPWCNGALLWPKVQRSKRQYIWRSYDEVLQDWVQGDPYNPPNCHEYPPCLHHVSTSSSKVLWLRQVVWVGWLECGFAFLMEHFRNNLRKDS